jgi:hypothetical protein
VKPDDLIDEVRDRDSFIAFVNALAKEREDAARIERENPDVYVVDGAHDWKNADIASYLFACLDYFTEKPFHTPDAEPNWRMFAEFLWCGKIIE